MVSEMILKNPYWFLAKKIKEQLNQTWAKINLQHLQEFA